jgi:hypothetical protein
MIMMKLRYELRSIWKKAVEFTCLPYGTSVLREKLVAAQIINKFPVVMECEGSLLFHRNPPTFSILSQPNPVHTLAPHLNIPPI